MKKILAFFAIAVIVVITVIIFNSTKVDDSNYLAKSAALGEPTESALMEYYNPEKYPLTPFEETTDYPRIKKGFTSKLEAVKKEAINYDYYIILPPYLLNELSGTLEQYEAAVKADLGYETNILLCDDCSPQDIRASLQEGYANGLKGALMIGDIPLAWYGNSPSDAFPTSMYYQDLDGKWIDENGDEIFEGHGGETDSEIFVGWLKSNDLTYSQLTEVELLKNYFERNLAYRRGELDFGEENLLVADDVLSSEDSEEIMPFTSKRTNLFSTSASDYRKEPNQEYKTVNVFAHSDPWVHGFTEADIEGQGCDWYNPSNPGGLEVKRCYNAFSSEDLVSFGPPKALFYAINGCVAGRLTETDNLGNWYVLQPEGGLGAIGGTMLLIGAEYNGFLIELAYGKTLGETFNAYLKNWAIGDDKHVLFGDPTLKISYPSFYHNAYTEKTSEVGADNELTVEISLNEKTTRNVVIDAILNGEKIGTQKVKVEYPGQTITFKFSPNYGQNIITTCFNPSDEPNKRTCTDIETIGVSPTIEINEDNYILDCDAQHLNPRLGWGGTGITVNAKNATIQNCELATFETHLGINDGEGLTIKDNKFYNEKNYAYGAVFPSAVPPIKNTVISNNKIEDLLGGILGVEYYENVLIAGNSFLGEMAGYLIRISGADTKGLTISNNYVCAEVNEGGYQIYCDSGVTDRAINLRESTGNNADFVQQCGGGFWPVYGEHYAECPQSGPIRK